MKKNTEFILLASTITALTSTVTMFIIDFATKFPSVINIVVGVGCGALTFMAIRSWRTLRSRADNRAMATLADSIDVPVEFRSRVRIHSGNGECRDAYLMTTYDKIHIFANARLKGDLCGRRAIYQKIELKTGELPIVIVFDEQNLLLCPSKDGERVYVSLDDPDKLCRRLYLDGWYIERRIKDLFVTA